MANEKQLIDNIKKGLRGKVYFQKHEDSYSPGIPDISYHIKKMLGSGWIEFKRKKEWPKKKDTLVKIHHFAKQQKNWLYKFGNINHKCFLFLQIEKDYMIFSHKDVYKIGKLNKTGLLNLAPKVWNPSINYKELFNILKRGSYEL